MAKSRIAIIVGSNGRWLAPLAKYRPTVARAVCVS
jgi:hypothetical protein